MTYWEKRALLREARSAKKANDLIDQLVSLYDKAEKEIVENIRKIIKNYVRSGGMDTKQAIKYLTEFDKSQDINELLKRLADMTDGEQKQELLRRINAPAYRARLDRLQVLQDRIDIKLTQLAAQEVRLNTIAFGDELVDAYYRACFDMQQQAGYMNVVERLENGITLSVTSGAILPTEAFEAALDYDWTARSYSDSVWENTHELAKEAKEIVQRGLLTGRSVPRMTAELEQRFRIAKHKAARVVRTEMNYFHNQGDLVAYEKMGVERYRYLATLDAVTCERCGALDNQVFSVFEAEPGKNFPPLHPNDRCTTTPALDDAVLAKMKRRARDPKTGKTYLVPANMSYTEWDEKQDMAQKTVDNPEDRGIIRNITIADLEKANIQGQIHQDCIDEIGRALEKYKVGYDAVRICNVPKESAGTPVFRTNITQKGSWCYTTLEINKEFFGGKKLEEINTLLKGAASRRHTVAQNIEEAILHESIHEKLAKDRNFAQYEALGEFLEDIHINGISTTASLNGEECLCETAVLLKNGGDVPEEAMLLWRKYVEG